MSQTSARIHRIYRSAKTTVKQIDALLYDTKLPKDIISTLMTARRAAQHATVSARLAFARTKDQHNRE